LTPRGYDPVVISLQNFVVVLGHSENVVAARVAVSKQCTPWISKTRYSRRGCAFWGCERCSRKFWE